VTPTVPTAPASTTPPEPTHGCARCGAPVALDVGLCEDCNPLGLRDVSASQVHGTVIIAVLVGFVLLAVGARLAVSGVGPFPATIAPAETVAGGLRVTLTVTNEGDATGQTTCRVTDATDRGSGPAAFVLSPRIDAKGTVTFSQTVTELGTAVRPLKVECRTP
jgi:hypothetical protein